MKTKEEIEQLAEKNFPIEEYPTNEGFEHFAYKQGYTQCQQYMDKKYTEEDMLKLWNTLMVAMTSKNPIFFSDYIKSLNKKDREEIQPNDIWNKESQEKIKEHILNLAKKQTPKDRLETELMAKKYKSEDYATKIMEVAYYGFPLVQRKETVHKIINALLIEYAEQK